MWPFIISGLVYIAAFWAASSYLSNVGLEAGSQKNILCGCFAFALSWMAGSAIEWLAPPPSSLSRHAEPRDGEPAKQDGNDPPEPSASKAPAPNIAEANALKAVADALSAP